MFYWESNLKAEHMLCCCQSSSDRKVKRYIHVKHLLSEVHIFVALRVHAPKWGSALHFSAWLTSSTRGKQHMPRCQKFGGCVWVTQGELIHLKWLHFLFLSSQEYRADLIHTYCKSTTHCPQCCPHRKERHSIWSYYFSKNHKRRKKYISDSKKNPKKNPPK